MSAIAHAPRKSFWRSPNRQRLVARAAVWTFGLGAAAFFVPHLLGA